MWASSIIINLSSITRKGLLVFCRLRNDLPTELLPWGIQRRTCLGIIKRYILLTRCNQFCLYPRNYSVIVRCRVLLLFFHFPCGTEAYNQQLFWEVSPVEHFKQLPNSLQKAGWDPCRPNNSTDCFVLFWWRGHFCPMDCDLFKIYCAPPNLGSLWTWKCRFNFAQRPSFSGLRFFNDPETSDSA